MLDVARRIKNECESNEHCPCCSYNNVCHSRDTLCIRIPYKWKLPIINGNDDFNAIKEYCELRVCMACKFFINEECAVAKLIPEEWEV